MKKSHSHQIDLAGKTCQYNMNKHNVPFSDKICGKQATYLFESKMGDYYLCDIHKKIINDTLVGGCMRE